MKQLHFILFWVMSIGLLAQAPQGIPYQAVVRNVDGTVMSNTAITITFKIHDVTAAGVVVYEETHAVTSNSQGLVSMNVGAEQWLQALLTISIGEEEISFCTY
jgi:ribosomal protein S12 methylthiotransferase accessory factor YcaO